MLSSAFQKLFLFSLIILTYSTLASADEPRRGDVISALTSTLSAPYSLVEFDYKVFPIPGGTGRVSVSGRAQINHDLFTETKLQELRLRALQPGIRADLWQRVVDEYIQFNRYGRVKYKEFKETTASGSITSFSGDLLYSETVNGFNWHDSIKLRRFRGIPRLELPDNAIIVGEPSFERALSFVVESAAAIESEDAKEKSYRDLMEQKIRTFYSGRVNFGRQNIEKNPNQITTQYHFTCNSISSKDFPSENKLEVYTGCDAHFLQRVRIANSTMRAGETRRIGQKIIIYYEDQNRPIYFRNYVKGLSSDRSCNNPDQWCTTSGLSFDPKWNGSNFSGGPRAPFVIWRDDG